MAKDRKMNNQQEFNLSLLLLLQVVLMFIMAPLVDNSGGQLRWIIDVVLALMAFVSIFIVADGFWRWVTLFGFALSLAGIALGSLLVTDHRTSAIIFALSGLLFSANVCWIVARKVFADGPVNLHRIRGAIVIYLHIALLFAMMDSLLAAFVTNAYSNLPKSTDSTLSAMVYFSLTTLTTIGYGDIVPLHPFARSLATLEAVIGQFYLGILIASLIGRHVADRQSRKP